MFPGEGWMFSAIDFSIFLWKQAVMSQLVAVCSLSAEILATECPMELDT